MELGNGFAAGGGVEDWVVGMSVFMYMFMLGWEKDGREVGG